jgi:DNA-binding transcriptional MerR regulator
MTQPDKPVLLRARAAADRLGKNVRTLRRWSERGLLPEPIRLGPRGDRHYRAEDIDALIANGASE